MYQLLQKYLGEELKIVNRIPDNTFIPFDPANTDYQQFKTDLYNGIELLDPEGNTMTPEQVNEFLSTIP